MLWGGGFKKLNADELSTICTLNTICTIQNNKQDITNNSPFQIEQIKITNATITNFTNNSTITSTSTDSQTFYLDNGNNAGKITHLTNKGNILGGIRIYGDNAINSLTNYGEMRGIWANGTQKITINNYGTIKTNQGSYQTISGGNNKAVHFMFEASEGCLSIEKYKIKIIETLSEFNAFTSYSDKTNNKNSHLIVWKHSNGKFVEFKDAQSRLILDIGSGFEFGATYKIAKLITDQNGDPFNDLGLDFSRLALSDSIKDFYSLTNSGEYFIIKRLAQIKETPISAIYKANVRAMNNFDLISKTLIFPRKSQKTQNIGRKHSSLRGESQIRRSNPNLLSFNADSALDSALSNNETFFYRNEAQNRRIQRQNKRNYNRVRNPQNLGNSQNQRNTQNLKADSANANNSLRDSANPTNSPTLAEGARGRVDSAKQNLQDYYFVFAPFVNHNLFAQSGRYNLSGFDYGFLTAFSANLAESNYLGAHFAFSYGTLNDKQDKDLSIRTMNFMLGLNYKLDLIWDMFFKARGEVFYFSNALDSATLKNIKPANLGFGASVSYGKNFDFKGGGVLGVEVGIDYKALKTNEVALETQSYQKALYNLIYADLGLNYAKYFGGFGINLGGGFKANLAPKLAESIVIVNSQNLNFTLDNDKFLGYANAGISYLLETKNFDMEFSLAYYGSYGDRIISNAGGFEWRVNW